MDLLTKIKKRKATKEYNPNKKIAQETLKYIFNFINSAPTSMGIEHWRLLSIRSLDVKKKIVDGFMEGNKQKFLDSSDAFIFITKNKEWFRDEKNHAELQKIIKAKSKAYMEEFSLKSSSEKINQIIEDEIKSLRTGRNLNVLVDDITEWSKRQAYIALGYTLVIATLKEINSTPMEGFTEKLKELLLKEKLITKEESVAVCCLLGYIDNTKHPTIGNKQLRVDSKEKFTVK